VSAKILVVEDEAAIAALLRDYLVAEGHEVRICPDGVVAANQALSWPADLVLLDVRLPGRDGFEVCREIRARSTMPVLMLTARVDEPDRIAGLDLGADDYITKPFSPREVMARVRAALRRGTAGTTADVGLVLDRDRLEARLDGRHAALSAIEFRLLDALAARPGAVLSRSRLIDLAYGHKHLVSERTIDSHLRNLRRKLDQSGLGRIVIDGVYGAGYRLAIREEPDAQAKGGSDPPP
jgi:two-component system response regulator BaeR